MNGKERIAAVLSHQTPDHVPVSPILAGITRKLTGVSYPVWSTDAKACADAYIAAANQFETDCLVTLIDLSIEASAWGQKVVYPEDAAAHPDYTDNVIKSIADYAKIKQIDCRNSERMMMHVDVCDRLVKAVGDRIPVVAFVFGPLGTLSMLRNQQKFYMDVVDDPEAVAAAAREITESLKQYVRLLAATGVDAIMFDTLFSSGSIMSKRMWVKMEAQLVKELADLTHELGLGVMIHNCGERIYFDVQIEAMHPEAINFLYPPDDCKDFAECKAKYGDKTVLIGAVPPVMAVYGTDEEWDAECRAEIDAMARGGGFVLSTGCEYPSGASFDRAKRMIDIAKTYGKY